jgi:7-cyano-7-deazaguanine synthase
MRKAVILLSGGLDSATCLAIAKNQRYECYALSFDYGQKQIAELNAAKKLAKYFAVDHKIIRFGCFSPEGVDLGFANIAQSALTAQTIEIPDYSNNGEIPQTYVPNRNTLFISCALSYAESIAADSIYIGASSIDYSGYPDCRPEYFRKFQELIALATKAGIDGKQIQIKTPLAALSKAETIKLGTELGIDYQYTISCYRANEKGEACGTCDSCHLRKQGFVQAQIPDPTRYYNSN